MYTKIVLTPNDVKKMVVKKFEVEEKVYERRAT